MTFLRTALRFALGARLPTAAGELRVAGPAYPVTIRRDKFGVPHIDALTPADAAFAVGFCHGQDRPFQLDLTVRLVRGRLAELFGAKALPADRVARTVGFRRAAEAQLPVVADEVRDHLAAYAAGVNAGATLGREQPPHETAFVGRGRIDWDAADGLGFLKLQSFFLPSNFDVELGRARLLAANAVEQVLAADPAADALAGDLKLFAELYSPPAASNGWAVGAERTATGRPLLASDPHLGAVVPGPWYLAHVRTPAWEVMGATFVGGPVFPVGHNGFAAWGVTAGLTDNSDLIAVTDADVTATRTETIAVKGAADTALTVQETRHGPVISPLVPGVTVPAKLALAAVWLQPRPVRGFFAVPQAKSFAEFRTAFREWPGLPLNIVYADAAGTVGRQLVGDLPIRSAGQGMLPGVGIWTGEFVPFEQMPFEENPPHGFVAAANADPGPSAAWLGADFLDPFRDAVIRESLAVRRDWTPAAFALLQTDRRCKPWELLKPAFSAVASTDRDTAEGLQLLREWDGVLDSDSSAAAVYELSVGELCRAWAADRLPHGADLALGGGPGAGPFAHSLLGDRHIGPLTRAVSAAPTAWAGRIEAAVAAAVRTLRKRRGPSPPFWGWGDARPLVLKHPVFGSQFGLNRVFGLGPVPGGGDSHTVFQQSARPLDPLAAPGFLPNLRAVFDVGDWKNCGFVLAGGQSENPCSPHYDDLFEAWQRGELVRPAWHGDDVLKAAVSSLRLTPSPALPR